MDEKTSVQVPNASNPSLLDTVAAKTNAPSAAPVATAVKANNPAKAFTGKPAGTSIADGFVGLNPKS
ncbi:MAG TPA: hypothetical protein VMD77_05605 [Candidatus Baltobacteraceae bacterium]|nr:hypothetical protein [Candidatus Baltobacteraceae bacterium]